MPTFIARLPYRNDCTAANAPPGTAAGDRRTVEAAGRLLRPRAHQPITRVCLTPPTVSAPEPGRPAVPALIDTGFSGTVCLTDDQATTWAGLSQDELLRHRVRTSRTGNYDLHRMNVWFWPNLPDAWALADRPFAEPLYFDTVMVCRPASPFAKPFPYFGLRAIDQAALHLVVDGERGTLTLRRRARFLGLRF